MTEKLTYESEALDSIHQKANTAKNECFFVGFLEGILANDRIEQTELEHVAQKWGPVLSFSNMRNQYVRACRVNSNERDML